MFDNGSGTCEIFFSDFRNFCIKFPAMLFPAFNMQLSFQNAILGKSFWTNESNKRRRLEAHVAKTLERGQQESGMALPSFQQILETMSAEDAIDSLNKVDSAVAFSDAQTRDTAPKHISTDGDNRKSQVNIWRCKNCGRQNKERKTLCVTCKSRRYG